MTNLAQIFLYFRFFAVNFEAFCNRSPQIWLQQAYRITRVNVVERFYYCDYKIFEKVETNCL